MVDVVYIHRLDCAVWVLGHQFAWVSCFVLAINRRGLPSYARHWSTRLVANNSDCQFGVCVSKEFGGDESVRPAAATNKALEVFGNSSLVYL